VILFVIGLSLAGLPILRSPAVSDFARPAAPLRFLQTALSQHRIVFLGDIHPLAEPKLLVTDLIQQQQEEHAIDLLALEVASEQQEWIDRYLTSVPEDPGILLDHPRTLRSHWGVSEEYLGIYRAVYQWNATHPHRPIHVLAADLLGWPITPLTPHMATGGFVNRDQWMAAAFGKALRQHPEWRVLIFMGGYHGLKQIGGQVAIGRVHDRFERWFAGYLLDQGEQVYSILTDARQQEGRPATRMFHRLSPAVRENFAIALDSTTDSVQEPLYDIEQDGFELEFWPARFPLRHAVDAMLVLNRTTPITLLDMRSRR
jgi:hypothetical protein